MKTTKNKLSHAAVLALALTWASAHADVASGSSPPMREQASACYWAKEDAKLNASREGSRFGPVRITGFSNCNCSRANSSSSNSSDWVCTADAQYEVQRPQQRRD